MKRVRTSPPAQHRQNRKNDPNPPPDTANQKSFSVLAQQEPQEPKATAEPTAPPEKRVLPVTESSNPPQQNPFPLRPSFPNLPSSCFSLDQTMNCEGELQEAEDMELG